MRTIGRTGYTMIEVVVVMLVIGILAAVAAPRYMSSLNRYRVEAAARRIVADLNHMRGSALMKGSLQDQWVSFDSSSEKYHMWFSPDPDHPSNEYWVEFSKTAYPVDLVSAAFTNTVGATSTVTVIYDMYGTANSGFSPVAPLASGQIVVASGSQQRTVVIDPVTGKASVL